MTPDVVLDFAIGPWITRVAMPAALFEQLQGTALAEFAGPAGPQPPDFSIAVRSKRPATDPELTEPSAPGLTCSWTGGRWRIARRGMVATADPGAQPSLAVEQWTDPSSLDTALRYLLAQNLPEKGGVLLHAATLCWQGEGFAFAGMSGVGKTTLACGHEPDAGVFCDEVSLVCRTPTGWWVYPTPFWGELAARAPIAPAPLAGGFLLVRGRESFRAPVTARDALRELLRCVLFFAGPASGSAAVLDTASLLVRQTSWEYLSCALGSRFWEVARRSDLLSTEP